MTTVIGSRQPLQVLSMSNQERRKSKRIAGTWRKPLRSCYAPMGLALRGVLARLGRCFY